jgi:hypothetical protein
MNVLTPTKMEDFKNYTREELIAWLCRNDRNGEYSDEDAEGNGWPPLTWEEAYEFAIELIKG